MDTSSSPSNEIPAHEGGEIIGLKRVSQSISHQFTLSPLFTQPSWIQQDRDDCRSPVMYRPPAVNKG